MYMSDFENLKEYHEVKDLLQKSTRLIFVLESPHKKELEHRCPVAGLSGKTMTKKLLAGKEQALGIVMKEFIESEERSTDLEVLGIMNICPIPMQRIAYNEHIQFAYKIYLHEIEKIRTSSKKKKKTSEEADKVFNEIIEDFRSRLFSLDLENVIFVPCGNFARFMFSEAVKDVESIQYIDEIPHPSYNSWGQKRYEDKMNKVLNAYQEAKKKHPNI